MNEWFHLLDNFHQYYFEDEKGIEQSYFYDIEENMFYYDQDEQGMREIKASEVPENIRVLLSKYLAIQFKNMEVSK